MIIVAKKEGGKDRTSAKNVANESNKRHRIMKILYRPRWAKGDGFIVFGYLWRQLAFLFVAFPRLRFQNKKAPYRFKAYAYMI